MKKLNFFIVIFFVADLILGQGLSASITQSNCHSQAYGKEWVATLTAHALIEDSEIPPEAGWSYKWYNNYGGVWRYKGTTSYPYNYINMDGLCEQYYYAKVSIYIDGSLFLTSNPKLVGCHTGPCGRGDIFGPKIDDEENSNIISIPNQTQLMGNYPNPFNPTTIIKYQLKEKTYVAINVYDILGKKIKTLVDENKNPGFYNVEFNANSLPSGVYIIRMSTNNYNASKKILLSK